jgi:WD40 repeat protein
VEDILCLYAFSYNIGDMIAQQRVYEMKVIGKHDDEVLGVFVNGNDSKFATCSLDETIRFGLFQMERICSTIKGHLGQVNNIFSGDDKSIAVQVVIEQ